MLFDGSLDSDFDLLSNVDLLMNCSRSEVLTRGELFF